MTFLQKVLVCTLVLGTAGVLSGDEPDHGDGEFMDKVLVVDCGDQGGTFTLENATLKEIGKRTFLVGSKTSEKDHKQRRKSTIAIAWENVDVLTIFESKEAFRNRYGLSQKAEVPVEFKIELARKKLEGLTVEIRRRVYYVAKNQAKLDRLAKSSDVDDQRILRRKQELNAVKAKLADLNSEKRQIEGQVEQLRHEAILQGGIVD